MLIRNDLGRALARAATGYGNVPRVRVVVDYRPALRERSGVGEYTHELARALTAAFPPGGASPLALTLFTSSWADRFVPDPDLGRATIVDRRVPVRLLNVAWHRLGWPPAETLAGGSFDVTHSLHPLIMPARHAAAVVTIHDLHFLTHPERTRAEIRRDYPALARAHAHRADRVIVVSKFTAGEVAHRFDLPPDRISVCPPGAPAWAPRERTPDNGYVLFFGTLEPRKNVGGLLDAYERLAGRRRDLPRLVLAGRAPASAKPWLDRLTRAPLQGLVEHIGYVDPSKRRALYDGARLLVQPSFEEGFGIPVLEAMTLGVPVVATDRGALPEVLGDAGPLVNPDDPDAMAGAIERMIDDAAFAAEARLKGLARARTFRWEETARRVYDTYRRAMEERASRHAHRH
jgi:glycosyltransferase involved in cell wall biosynthesis